MVWKKKWCAGAGGALLLLLISMGLILVAYLEHEEDPALLVVTRQGTVKGQYISTREDQQVLSFERIPYARPPVGELRFKSPQPPERWEGVLDATQEPPKCTQKNVFRKEKYVSGQEDCLYINVYTPHIMGHHLLDVMVYIHGGGWIAGAGTNHRPQYLLDKNVVLVTFNYRLGPLGFLSTGDSACPGNNGLKDQVAALRWVRENIAAFGGNPGSVTIFGESAGGASVHYLMLSPLSRGLFHRAISQSGTAFCSWSLAEHGSTTNKTEKLATLLDCPVQSSSALLDCLRKKDAKEITDAAKNFTQWGIHPTIPFQPVLESGEDAFLPASPQELAKNLSHTVPWMTGITSEEGAFTVSRLYEDDMLQDMEDNFEDVVSITLLFSESSTDKTDISKQIKDFYFGDKNITNSSISSIVNLYTDAWFLHGADEAVKIHSLLTTSPVYYYYFGFRGSRSLSSVFGDASHDYGVCHGDDLLYLFPFPGKISEEDEHMIDIMTSLWANFAHRGDPTPSPIGGVKWPRVFSPSNSEYLEISKDGLQVKQGLLKKRAQFWESLFLQNSSKTQKKDEL